MSISKLQRKSQRKSQQKDSLNPATTPTSSPTPATTPATTSAITPNQERNQPSFAHIIQIKHAPFHSLPNIKSLLEATVQLVEINAADLLLLAATRKGNQCCVFEPDYFTKLIIHCDTLNQEEFEEFAYLFQCALVASEAEVEQFPYDVMNYNRQFIYLVPGLTLSSSTSTSSSKFIHYIQRRKKNLT